MIARNRVIAIKIAKENVARFNDRVGAKLDKEQYRLAKKLRKPRNEDPFESLLSLYQYVDRVYSHTSGLVACTRGCSYCCHIPVQLTRLEVAYIASRIGSEVHEPLVSIGHAPAPKAPDPARPCPFLRNQECSIYEHRPLSCSTHVNFEPTNEVCSFQHDGTENALLIDRERSFPAVLKTLSSLGGEEGSRICEIRDYIVAPRTTR